MTQKIKYSIKATAVALSFFLVHINLYAQKNGTDTLAPLKDFIAISTGYKTMPLYLELEMKSSTSFITSPEDTGTLQGQFYLQKERSYVRWGEFEQIVNDSMALLVSDRLRQMMLYTNAGPVIQQMKNMTGMALPDSSVSNLAKRYASSAKELTGDISLIELLGRSAVPGTSLPKESILLKYDRLNKNPVQVITIKRNLLQLDSLQYDQLKKQFVAERSSAGALVIIEGKYFLIKELSTAYNYKKIDKQENIKVPVQVSDRILKNEQGEYEPVKKYAPYRLIKND